MNTASREREREAPGSGPGVESAPNTLEARFDLPVHVRLQDHVVHEERFAPFLFVALLRQIPESCCDLFRIDTHIGWLLWARDCGNSVGTGVRPLPLCCGIIVCRVS